MNKRYQVDVWNPDRAGYETYSLVTAKSPEEVRDWYAEQRKKYPDVRRHMMIKPPRLFLIGSKFDEETRQFELHDPIEVPWPDAPPKS